MKNRCLYDYVYYPGYGLKEDLSKLLFYKILTAIKICHDSHICIRDIKLENILLDDNYIQYFVILVMG
jgi:serine/threonine protein kinase